MSLRELYEVQVLPQMGRQEQKLRTASRLLRLHVNTLKLEGWTTWEPTEPHSALTQNLKSPSNEMHGSIMTKAGDAEAGDLFKQQGSQS